MNMKNPILAAMILYCGCMSAQTAHEMRDSVKIYFRQGKIDLVSSLKSNQVALDRIADSLRTNYADSIYQLKKILVVGGASPEGSVKINKWLSEERASVLFNYLSRYGALPESLKSTEFLGRDWDGLIGLVEADPKMPYKHETLGLLRKIADEVHRGITKNGDPLRRIQRLRGGVPYNYMYRKFFPELRASRLYLWYDKVRNPVLPPPPEPEPAPAPEPVIPQDSVAAPDTVMPPPERPFYMDIRTNMLYDALLVPNIGAEFYLGKGISIMGNWMYGWWKRDPGNWYWRTYGGDLTLRKWIGRAAKEKPLTGHHVGVYGQIFTYDFETGGRGYLGGKPGGTLWEKMNYGVGAEYGYSLPIRRRLNIDFSIGIGYWGGIYHEYDPEDGCYVWQSTRKRRWFGPTKAEISLVWLIGKGNFNNGKKGGRR